MPTDACQFFYDCKGCGARLKPESGRLLRILFVRIGALSAAPNREWLCVQLMRPFPAEVITRSSCIYCATTATGELLASFSFIM